MCVSSASLGLLLLPSRSSLSSPPQSLSLYFSIRALENPSFLKFSIGSRWAIHKRPMWRGGPTRRGRENYKWRSQSMDGAFMFGSDEEFGAEVPTQAQSLVEGSSTVPVSEYKPIPDLDYIQKNHIFTSGASGTNAAVIRGALRAEKPELLSVILPQSLKMQPPESQVLLAKLNNLIEKPDHLPLIEASRLCNEDILSHVQQVICFAFHGSRLLMETYQKAKNLRKIVTLFYLD